MFKQNYAVAIFSVFTLIALGLQGRLRAQPAAQAKTDTGPKTITLAAGTLAPVVYTRASNVTITASGPITLGTPTFVKPGQIAPSGWSIPAAISLVYCKDVTIEAMDIDGAGTPQIGIALWNCENCKVLRNKIKSLKPNGAAVICSLGGKHNTYDSNTINDTGQPCRGMWLGNVQIGNGEDFPTITRNTITNCGATGIGVCATGAIIRYNDVENNAGSGLALGGMPRPLLTTWGAVVEANRFVGNLYAGIQGDQPGATNATAAIGECTIRGNVCDKNKNFGIYVEGARAWTVTGNALSGNSSGDLPVVLLSWGCTVDGVIIHD